MWDSFTSRPFEFVTLSSNACLAFFRSGYWKQSNCIARSVLEGNYCVVIWWVIHPSEESALYPTTMSESLKAKFFGAVKNVNDKLTSLMVDSTSPGPSPRASPRPSPKPVRKESPAPIKIMDDEIKGKQCLMLSRTSRVLL